MVSGGAGDPANIQAQDEEPVGVGVLARLGDPGAAEAEGLRRRRGVAGARTANAAPPPATVPSEGASAGPDGRPIALRFCMPSRM